MSEENLDLVNAPVADTQDQAPVSDGASESQPATEAVEQPAPAAEEAPKEDKGLPKGIERRFAKMTKRHHEDQARLAEMESKLANLTAEPAKMREEYSDDEWIDKVAEDKFEAKWNAKQQEVKDQAAAQAQAAEQATAWNDRISKFSEEIPDYSETLAEADIQLPVDVLNQITASEVGPKIAYHLAKNPDQANQLSGLSETQRGIAVARLEMRLETEAPKNVALTKAAPTPKGGGSGGGSYDPLGDNASMADWMKARNKQVHKN